MDVELIHEFGLLSCPSRWQMKSVSRSEKHSVVSFVNINKGMQVKRPVNHRSQCENPRLAGKEAFSKRRWLRLSVVFQSGVPLRGEP